MKHIFQIFSDLKMDDDLNYVRRNHIVHHGSLADSLQLNVGGLQRHQTIERNDDDTEPAIPGKLFYISIYLFERSG